MLQVRNLNNRQWLILGSVLFVLLLLLLILIVGPNLFNKTGTEKQLIAPTSPEWLYTNGPWKKVNEPGWGEVMKGWLTSADKQQIGRRAKIETNSSFAILKQRNIGGNVTIFVDGKLVLQKVLSSENEIPIYSDSKGWHHIEIVFSYNSEIDGLYISKKAKVRQPEENKKKLVVIGHSYVDGTGSSNRGLTSFVPLLGDILGVDSINQGISRTDINFSVPARAANSGLDRVQEDIVQIKPDYVLSVYGYNGVRVTPEQYQADYTKFIKSIRDSLPETRIFASGIIAVPNKSEKDSEPYNQAIKDACASDSSCTFVDLSGKWNSDNYKKYVFRDGTHPNDEGYRFLAEEYAKVISTVTKK